MARPPLAPEIARKSVSLPADLWAEIAEFRHAMRIGTEGEAIRRLLVTGLKAEAQDAKPAAKAPKRASKASA